MEILNNHIGYESKGCKIALLGCSGAETPGSEACFVLEKEGIAVLRAPVKEALTVSGWKNRRFFIFDFSEIEEEGEYRVILGTSEKPVCGSVFRIQEGLVAEAAVSDILFYYKSQRCSWRWNEADKNVPFFGERDEHRDVSGGWFDAAGDYSKYLTHLSYSNYLNPQQTPLVVWSLLSLFDHLDADDRHKGTLLVERAEEESMYGADFLVRMQDPDGYFYTTVFDQWSKDEKRRMIASFTEMKGNLFDTYQAGYRQGGGMAIASLAKASRMVKSGEFSRERYLESAVSGFDHLEKHNIEYLDNGQENIIDHYCALMAAVELYKSTDEAVYLEAARSRAAHLGRLYNSEGGYWLVEENSERPYFHAAEAGLPVIAIIEYYGIETDESSSAAAARLIRTAVKDFLSLTGGRDENPFLLARQWVQAVGGSVKQSFFVPHENETGYWWQGENARLASISAAVRRSLSFFGSDEQMKAKLNEFADAQLHWILGCNPYDVCMMQGHGRNNPSYEKHYPNAPGGICNGITGGLDDEDDLDFLPESVANLGEYRWRWSEQWIPHAAWFLLALIS